MDQAKRDAPVVDVLNQIVAKHGRWGFGLCFSWMRNNGLTSSHELDISDLENPAGLTSSHELDISDLENPAGLRFIKLLGKQRWRDIIQRRMRSKMIIVLSPGFDLFLGVLKRHKPVGV